MKTIINCFLTMLCICYGGAASAQPAQITPLASQSLMTDVESQKKTVIAVGEFGHILYSQDEGKTFTQGKVPVDSLLTAVSMFDENTAWAVGHDGVVIKTEDGGQNWTLLHRTLDKSEDTFVDPLLDVHFWNAQEGLAVGAFGQVFQTDDGGHTWIDQRSKLPNEDELHLNKVIRTPEGQFFIASEYGSLFRSDDNGHSWYLSVLPAEVSFLALANDQTNNRLLTAGIAGNAFMFFPENDQAAPITLRMKQSVFSSTFHDGTFHLVGAKGIWQTGEKLLIDPLRRDYHAISFTESGIAVIATSAGVHVSELSALQREAQ